MPVNYERQMVDTEVSTLSVKYRKLSELAETIQNLIADYGPDANIFECQYEYSDDRYFAVMVKLPESDHAYKKRIEAEERWHELQQQRDKAEYERLKTKFGKS
jgi:hypothetical protein